MVLSDLEWLSKIFSDTKRRAVSLLQLSFCSIFGSVLLPASVRCRHAVVLSAYLSIADVDRCAETCNRWTDWQIGGRCEEMLQQHQQPATRCFLSNARHRQSRRSSLQSNRQTMRLTEHNALTCLKFSAGVRSTLPARLGFPEWLHCRHAAVMPFAYVGPTVTAIDKSGSMCL